MSATAGWYPDPGGRPGLFRYWDGKAWSAATTEHPGATPPPGALGGTAPGTTPLGRAPGGPGLGGSVGGQPYAGVPVPLRRRSPVAWLVGALAVVVVIALVALGVRLLGGSSTDPGPDPDPTGSAPTTSVSPVEAQCPPQSSAEPSASTVPDVDGRVVSGKLSYPTLAAPFGEPVVDDRVPFGTDVRSQTVTVENENTNKVQWAAGVIIATLRAGDGFYGPEQGAKLVARCIVGTFYDNYEIGRKDTSSKATTVDGHDAWLIEAQLSYDIPDVRAKTELLLVLVVDTEDGNAGLFYGSVPDTAPELVAPAREALKELRVS